MLHVVLDLFVTEVTTNETLEGEDSVCRVNDSLSLRGKADKTLAMFCEGDDGRCCTCTLAILNHF